MYGVPATPASCSNPKRPPATTPGTTPRRRAMNRMGSISRPNDPPCGMRRGNAWAIQLRAAASATATPISAMARTPQCAGLRLRRARTSGAPGEWTTGVLTLTSLPSLALPSSARGAAARVGRSGSTRRRQEAPSQLLTRELRRDIDSVPQRVRGGRAESVSSRCSSVHSSLWIVWITSFCHALRLTIAVDKALTRKCCLDTSLTRRSSAESSSLQRSMPSPSSARTGLTDGALTGLDHLERCAAVQPP